MTKLSFGIKTAPQHTTYEAMQRIWLDADALEVFEHAWLFDHFNPIVGDLDGPCFEGWTLLTAFAAQTRRIRVGLMVAGNTYRHPAVLAHIAATLDIIANGRLDIGIGAGWNVYEHESMGLELYQPGERIRRLGEACEIMKRPFTEPVVDFAGRYYQLKQARLEPKPIQKPYPPFVIGGSGEKLTLRVTARYADVWNFAGGTPDDFRRKVSILHEHCAAVGRNPADIALSIQIPVNYDDLNATAAHVQSFVDAGANHLILNLRYPYPDGIVHRLAAEVVPQIKAI
ncbi:MAG TPA: TIGR03560 family F420-dependent LLM class oxidoreductase [Roseiflexaceae bacterium]|nr:TIGR03560 family F420-dependent LLM class oxidoreductase [Roseiflexaceae bacterium]